jgi:hypothetical protein
VTKATHSAQQPAASASKARPAPPTTAGAEIESEDEDAAQQSLLPTTASTSKAVNSNGKRQQADFTSQRDLVAEAFAGDDVVSDFQRDKKRQMEADAPTVQDTSLPGWVSTHVLFPPRCIAAATVTTPSLSILKKHLRIILSRGRLNDVPIWMNNLVRPA